MDNDFVGQFYQAKAEYETSAQRFRIVRGQMNLAAAEEVHGALKSLLANYGPMMTPVLEGAVEAAIGAAERDIGYFNNSTSNQQLEFSESR